jgi:hypothetical protein
MRFVLALAPAFVAFAGIACRSDVDHLVNPKPGVEIDTATTNVPQFTDIPVPQGFSVPKNNLDAFITEAGSYRAGRQVYFGTARAFDTVTYYEERMPNHGWTLVERGTRESGDPFMVWRKADTVAVIDLSDDARAGTLKLQVKVGTSLDPKFRP